MRETDFRATHIEGIPHHPKQSWDIGAISQALDQPPGQLRDAAHGLGVQYTLADGALTVTLFPPHAERSKGIVRLTTVDSLQEFYRQPQPAIREEGLIFETHNHLISLSPTGALMTYHLVPDDGNQGAGGDFATSGRPFQNALPETEGQPRVTYSGRLGTHPRTKTTPKGRFVMEFPVAIVVEGREKPEWRSTVVFDAKARQLDEVLAKGTVVDVVAYEHRKLSRDPKSGRRRERVEYYATAVTPKPRSSRVTEAPPTLPGQ